MTDMPMVPDYLVCCAQGKLLINIDEESRRDNAPSEIEPGASRIATRYRIAAPRLSRGIAKDEGTHVCLKTRTPFIRACIYLSILVLVVKFHNTSLALKRHHSLPEHPLWWCT